MFSLRVNLYMVPAAALAGEKIAASAGLGFTTQMDPILVVKHVVSQVLTLF